MSAVAALIEEFGATAVSCAVAALGYESMPFDDETALVSMASEVRAYLEGA